MILALVLLILMQIHMIYVDIQNGVVIKASNFPTWDHVPLADLIKKETGVKVFFIFL